MHFLLGRDFGFNIYKIILLKTENISTPKGDKKYNLLVTFIEARVYFKLVINNFLCMNDVRFQKMWTLNKKKYTHWRSFFYTNALFIYIDD